MSHCLPHSLADEKRVCSLIRPGQRRASLAQHGGARLPTLAAPFSELLAHRALNPPTSSALAEEIRLSSLLLSTAARDCRRSQLSPVDTIDGRRRQPKLDRDLLTDPWRPLLARQKDLTQLHVWRLEEPAFLAVDRVRA